MSQFKALRLTKLDYPAWTAKIQYQLNNADKHGKYKTAPLFRELETTTTGAWTANYGPQGLISIYFANAEDAAIAFLSHG
jgi:hypothetical protein